MDSKKSVLRDNLGTSSTDELLSVYATAVSGILLVFQFITLTILGLRKPAVAHSGSQSGRTWAGTYFEQPGGIIAFVGFRLVAALVLTVLSFVSLKQFGNNDATSVNLALFITLVRFETFYLMLLK